MKKNMILPFVDYSSLHLDKVFTRIYYINRNTDVSYSYISSDNQYISKQKGYMITHVRYGDIIFFIKLNIYLYSRIIPHCDIMYFIVQGFRIKKYNTKTKRLVYDKEEKIQSKYSFGANYNKNNLTYESTEECISNNFSLYLQKMFTLGKYHKYAKRWKDIFEMNNIDEKESFFLTYIVIPMMYDKVYQTDFYCKMFRETFLYRGL